MWVEVDQRLEKRHVLILSIRPELVVSDQRWVSLSADEPSENARMGADVNDLMQLVAPCSSSGRTAMALLRSVREWLLETYSPKVSFVELLHGGVPMLKTSLVIDLLRHSSNPGTKRLFGQRHLVCKLFRYKRLVHHAIRFFSSGFRIDVRPDVGIFRHQSRFFGR